MWVLGADLGVLPPLPQVVDVQQVTRKHWELTDEGRDVARTGSHEAKVFNAIPAEGIPQAELMVRLGGAGLRFLLEWEEQGVVKVTCPAQYGLKH